MSKIVIENVTPMKYHVRLHRIIHFSLHKTIFTVFCVEIYLMDYCCTLRA